MKIQKNNKIAGRLLMASGGVFFIVAVMTRQPAFSGVGAALFTIGVAISSKRNKSC